MTVYFILYDTCMAYVSLVMLKLKYVNTSAGFQGNEQTIELSKTQKLAPAKTCAKLI